MARRRKKPAQPVKSNNWIRTGDTVEVIAGADKGTRNNPKRGKVLRVLPETGQVIVEGVRKVFQHKRKSQENPRGGRVEKEAPIHISNVALVCPSTGKPTRRKLKIDGDKKVRISAHDGSEIPRVGRS